MPEFTTIIWNDEPGGNVGHFAEHGVTPDEAEEVIAAGFAGRMPSETTPAHWVVDGFTTARRGLRVVFEYIEELDIVIPVTGYERQPKE